MDGWWLAGGRSSGSPLTRTHHSQSDKAWFPVRLNTIAGCVYLGVCVPGCVYLGVCSWVCVLGCVRSGSAVVLPGTGSCTAPLDV